MEHKRKEIKENHLDHFHAEKIGYVVALEVAEILKDLAIGLDKKFDALHKRLDKIHKQN